MPRRARSAIVALSPLGGTTADTNTARRAAAAYSARTRKRTYFGALAAAAFARARAMAARNSCIGAAPRITSSPTKNVGVDDTPADRPRPRSADTRRRITCDVMQARHSVG